MCIRTVLLALSLGLVGCRPPVHYVTRTAMFPPRPDNCPIKWDNRVADERRKTHDIIGFVVVYGDDALEPKELEKIRVEACHLGGDIVAFGSDGSRATAFYVLRQKPGATPAPPPPSTGPTREL
jgi:hypothetical protein